MLIEHIDDVLPYVKDVDGFVIGERDGYTFIDYVTIVGDIFNHPMHLECRGIKFDRDGKILARPFKKFFNVGERQETPDSINEKIKTIRHSVVSKLDGSMVHPAVVDNHLYFMTRKGITDVAEHCFKIFGNNVDYFRFCWHCLWNLNVTPIFEYTGPENRIVIEYTEPRLTLIGARHTITGEDYFESVKRIADEYSVPYVMPFSFKKYSEKGDLIGFEEVDRVHDIHEFTAVIRDMKDEEGVIIRFADGHMVKMKADDYVLKHKTLNDLNSKKKVTQLILSDGVDDVLPIVDENLRLKLIQYETKINSYLLNVGSIIVATLRECNRNNLSRKDIALTVVKEFPFPAFKNLIFAGIDGQNVREKMKEMVFKNPDLLPFEWEGI